MSPESRLEMTYLRRTTLATRNNEARGIQPRASFLTAAHLNDAALWGVPERDVPAEAQDGTAAQAWPAERDATPVEAEAPGAIAVPACTEAPGAIAVRASAAEPDATPAGAEARDATAVLAWPASPACTAAEPPDATESPASAEARGDTRHAAEPAEPDVLDDFAAAETAVPGLQEPPDATAADRPGGHWAAAPEPADPLYVRRDPAAHCHEHRQAAH